MTLTVKALDPERQVKAIPFFYVSKLPGVDGGMPYQMSVDKQEDDSIFSAKIVHKTLHSQDSYQIFEFAKVNQTAENNFGVFAINTASLETLPIWQPEVLL